MKSVYKISTTYLHSQISCSSQLHGSCVVYIPTKSSHKQLTSHIICILYILQRGGTQHTNTMMHMSMSIALHEWHLTILTCTCTCIYVLENLVVWIFHVHVHVHVRVYTYNSTCTSIRKLIKPLIMNSVHSYPNVQCIRRKCNYVHAGSRSEWRISKSKAVQQCFWSIDRLTCMLHTKHCAHVHICRH